MSDGKRYPRSDAIAVARELCDELKANTERLIVAGSLRRGKQEIGDVEILFVPKIEMRQNRFSLFPDVKPVDLADERINYLLTIGWLAKRAGKSGVFAWGEKNKLAIHVKTGIPVDLFATTEDNWFVSVVIRTGGKATNLLLTTGAQRLGRKLHAYGNGVTMPGGSNVRATSEQHVFELCGVPYREPKARP